MTTRPAALPDDVRELLAAVVETLALPRGATLADEEARGQLLSDRAFPVVLALRDILADRPGNRRNIAWNAAYLRDVLAERPATYRAHGTPPAVHQVPAATLAETETVADAGRCPAAHPDDPTPCDGPPAVAVLDAQNASADGCEHHAARLLASLDGGRVHPLPGAPDGAAIRVFTAAEGTRPFPWLTDAPRTRPDQLSHAENRQARQPDPSGPEKCARCRRTFDPDDTRFDGRAKHGTTPFCRSCVDRCHESTDAFHACPVCDRGGETR